MTRFLTAAILSAIIAAPAIGATGRVQQAANTPRCTEITDVTVVPHGFFIAHLDEFVAQEDVRPSADGRYWRCADNVLLVPASAY